MKEIILNFSIPVDNYTECPLSCIAGNSFGRQTFKEQVESQTDFVEKTIIVFPPYIKVISDNFIQGFMSAAIDKVKDVSDKFEFKSETLENIVEMFNV